MWFARLFGGRDDGSDDELPTAAAPQPPVREAVPQPTSVQNAARPAQKKPQGFDPYNSGSFEHRNAWERVNRR